MSGRARLYTLFTRLLACTNLFLRVFDRMRVLQVPCIPVCLSSGDSATFPCRTACDVSKPDRRMTNCNPTAHKYMATTHELPVSRMTSRVTSRPDHWDSAVVRFNPLNLEFNPICYLLALLGAHHFLHVSRIRVKLLTFRRLMSCIYAAPILDVSRSHTTTQQVGRTPLDE